MKNKGRIDYCVDIGSIKSNNFAWAGSAKKDPPILLEDLTTTGSCLNSLADSIVMSHRQGYKITLGLECPLYFELQEDGADANRGRSIDGNRPWSAGAGASVAITGLAQISWLFRRLKNDLGDFLEVEILQDLKSLENDSHIYIWEAFISGGKSQSHLLDCLKALNLFKQQKLLEPAFDKEYFSFIGSVLLHAGWSKDLTTLHKACCVVKGSK